MITIFLIFSFSLLKAQTDVSGTINTNTTWTKSGSPYNITGNVTVTTGVILTVEDSVLVRFNNNTGLIVLGAMTANEVDFTSIQASPAPGDWNYIQVGNGSYDGTVNLTNCTVSYGGVSSVSAGNSMLYVYRGNISMTNCDISFSKNSGFRAQGGTSVSIKNSNVFSCDWPFTYYGDAAVELMGSNNFTGNKHDGFYMYYSSSSSAMVLDTLEIPYVYYTNFTINAGGSLEIASGNMIKFTQNARLTVNGRLTATAANDKNIYFSAYTDDNLGGDTNADGAATIPAARYWDGIVFTDLSDDASILNRCRITFSGSGNIGGITTVNASPTITNCEIQNSYYGLMFQYDSNPVVSGNTIGSSLMVPVALSFEADPQFTDNEFSFQDNTYDAIGILDGTLQADAKLIKRSVTGTSNVTYLLLGTIIVPQTRTLTIEKGIVIKSYSGSHRIRVQGKMVAVGTANPDSMITFTSVKDDTHGNPNDTDRNGDGAVPGRGDWSGIIFEDQSDAASILSYCRIKYAQLSSTYMNNVYISGGAITTSNASPTIDHCDINNVYYGIFAFQASNPNITNNTISNTARTPVIMSASANPVFSGNTFSNVAWTALGIFNETLGVNSTLKRRDVAGNVNITYVLMGNLIVNSSTKLTVEAGVVVKCFSGSAIYVDGGLRMIGDDISGKIVFSSLYDDNVGNPGDTENNGTGSAPARGNWETIHFRATADDGFNQIENCELRYGGSGSWGALSFTDASGTITKTLLTDSYNYGIRCAGISLPSFDQVTIQNCRLDPIAMSLLSNPTFTNMTFAGNGNGSNGIRILEGTLTVDATLVQRSLGGIENIAYIVDNLTVGPDATFTINPGVVIKFVGTTSVINVNGALVAIGTTENNIVFTSLKDDSKGGDTNDDGANSSPAQGDWWSIHFGASSRANLNSVSHCLIHYGGRDQSYWYDVKDFGAIRVTNSTALIENCSIEFSHTSGFGIYGSASPTIRNNEIFNNRLTPVTLSMFSTPTFSGNTISNTGIIAFGLAVENYSISGTVPKWNFAGYTNISYYLYSTETINSGTTITIPAGVVFKHNNFTAFKVDGALVTTGTAENPVVLTHEYDDDYGNPKDTNNNGAGSTPSIYTSNYSIQFSDISNDAASSISHTVMRYHAAGIDLNSASPTIDNCTFDKDSWGVVLRGVSQPVITNNKFNNLTYCGVILSLVSHPSVLTGNILSGTTYRAIGVLSEELVQNVTLQKIDFAGYTDIPYYFSGNYSIGTSVVLTIEPGVIMKFPRYIYFTVRRGLLAIGNSSPEGMIVFTDIRDDFYGGDTNADSNATVPAYNTGWSGIRFVDQANDTECQLKHCVIRYTGTNSGDAGLIATSASPTLDSCVVKDNRNGIIINGAANPSINRSDIYDNLTFGINNTGSFTVNAENNWWGTNDGPTHSSNPGGTGDAVSNNVDYTPFLTSGALNPLLGDVSLNGIVQAFDASMVLQETVAPGGLMDRQLQVADVSGTGGVTAYDASLILMKTVGLIQTFPAELMETNPDIKPAELAERLNLAKEPSALLEIGDFSAAAGTTVRIPISVSNVNDANAFQMALNLDAKMLRVLNVEVGKSMAKISFDYKYNTENGVLRMAFAGADFLKPEGDLAIITVAIDKEIKGEQSIPITVAEFLVNETDLTEMASSGNIEVTGTPVKFDLFQNYPNPFNPSTTIRYQIPDNDQQVRIEVFNIMGQSVRVLVDTRHDAGEYQVVWDGTNKKGILVASGLYFYRMQAGNFVSLKKFHLLK